jgi:hypothetical protein
MKTTFLNRMHRQYLSGMGDFERKARRKQTMRKRITLKLRKLNGVV